MFIFKHARKVTPARAEAVARLGVSLAPPPRVAVIMSPSTLQGHCLTTIRSVSMYAGDACTRCMGAAPPSPASCPLPLHTPPLTAGDACTHCMGAVSFIRPDSCVVPSLSAHPSCDPRRRLHALHGGVPVARPGRLRALPRWRAVQHGRGRGGAARRRLLALGATQHQRHCGCGPCVGLWL